jgi:alpha-1,2-mannosyltransferase
LEQFYSKFTTAAGVFTTVLVTAYFLIYVDLPYDLGGYLVGRDFVNTWMSGRIALQGDPAQWFDAVTYNEALREQFGQPDYPVHAWSYPPQLLLFTWVFGMTPYFVGLALWTAAGLLALFLSVRKITTNLAQLAFIFLAPAVTINILAGQNGLFTAALMICGLSLMDRRPLLAGVAIGLLTIKPQLGLLLPLMLVMTGRWRVIGSATVTVLALVAATTAIYGADIWIDYVKVVMPMQTSVLETGGGVMVPMMPTPFQNMRVVGLPLEICWAIQAVVSVLAAAAVIWTFMKRRDPALSIALLITATFLATPYAFNYDMVVFGWVIALLWSRPDQTMLDHRLSVAVWLLPVLTIALGLMYIPLSSGVLIAFAARLIWRLRRADVQGANAPAAPEMQVTA